MKRAYDSTGDVRAALAGIPYEDITAALDYYFENYNNGRPFIIASHSQGSAINSLVLKDYFREHPEYYERMVAAYLIGFSITKDYLDANPHLTFAAGESDTGVIVSWNTEGKQNVEENATNVVVMPGAISINPLSWKLDDEYAPASENLGSLLIDENAGTVSIGDIGADAQIDTQRGVIVTNAKSDPIALSQFFGPASFHNGDYTFYYNNIKDNVARRIVAYMAAMKDESKLTVRPQSPERQAFLNEKMNEVRAQYGENRQITDGQYDKSLAVKCVNGTFVGRKSEGVITYKGIPFVGKQPVGEYRWKAPVDFEPDDGVYEAYYNAKSAYQMLEPTEPASLFYHGEDCLYLNIWTTGNTDGEKKPVIVWIHGGGYMVGGTVDPLHDCYNFVKENNDVVFVSIPYRLGLFGFLHLSHLPDGADYPDAQNLGILDQIMALKWVHENIAGFGGDPERITIFGESSGGGSVSLLPLVPGSHAYIKRVIADSGSPCLTRTTEQAIQCTTELMAELGCETVADLQKIDIQRLLIADSHLQARITPEKDGIWLPLDPYEAYANGAAKDIDILQGCNKDEGNYYLFALGAVEPGVEFCKGVIARKMAEMTEEEKALVQGFCDDVQGEDYEHVTRLIEHLWYTAPLIRLSENQARAGGKSYTWLFTVESAYPLMKCGHSVELPTLFNHPEMTEFTGRQFDETFSKTMRRMWVQFAKTGNPSLTADLSPDGKDHVWPLYDTENKWLMVFEEFDIHPERESDRKLVDWERTYFLTNYYC